MSDEFDPEYEEEIEGYECPKCEGHGHDKWGEVCKMCGGEGVVYGD